MVYSYLVRKDFYFIYVLTYNKLRQNEVHPQVISFLGFLRLKYFRFYF